ncbi:MAG TPA: hydantoinase B/oxoprolinase family protein [Solirubrobacteraceae bacterium]|jgi:N-methylhydantoinase B
MTISHSPGDDALKAEVYRKALENVTHEMGIALVRTSGSGAVYDGKDFCTCILDVVPEHIAFSGYVTFHIGSSLVGAQALVQDLPDDLRPGDGFILSDPRTAGAMHQADIGIMMPVFVEDEVLGWTFANVHVLDVGGVGISGKAPGARDIYQEGLRFPPLRVIRDRQLDREWARFLAANVRRGDRVLNDVKSLIAANIAGERKMQTLIERYGVDQHLALVARNKDLTEELLRSRIRSMRDGVYEVEDWAEFDGHGGPDMLLDLHARLLVDGDRLHFEFAGAPQIDGFVNCSKGAMYGQCMAALMVMLCYGDFPINAGLWRPVTIDLGPEGTVVNAVDPAPCSNGHSEVGMRACKMTKSLLAQALSLSSDPAARARVAGQSQDGTASVALFGPDRRGQSSVIFYVDQGVGIGGAAQTVGDGQDAYGATAQLGCGLPDVENHESDDPVLWLWREIVENSGGPGMYRGGQGISQGFILYGSERLGGPGFNACAEVPPRGFGGGSPGAAGRHYVLRESNVWSLLSTGILPTRARVSGWEDAPAAKTAHQIMGPTDIQVWQGGGGGGLGDALLRPPENVLRDILDGYITEAHALAAYGVVIEGDSVDREATLASRRERRSARLGEPPLRDVDPAAAPGAPLVANASGAWACGYCGARLGSTPESLEPGAVLEYCESLTARFDALGMYVRARKDLPVLEIAERYCASCGSVLAIDVVTSGDGESHPGHHGVLVTQTSHNEMETSEDGN